MPRKKTVANVSEIKVKPRTKELGELLARKIFKLQFNEPTINDTIERLIVLEAHKYGLLNAEESKAVKEYFDIADFEPTFEGDENYEPVKVPTTGTMVYNPTPISYTTNFRQPTFNGNSYDIGIPTATSGLLPLGNIDLEEK
jgi:hypothetical protein